MDKKIKTEFAIGIIFILAVSVAGMFLFSNKSIFKNENCSSDKKTENITTPVQKEQLINNNSDEGKESLSALTYPLGQYLLTFRLTAPKIWRTTLENRNNLKMQFNAYNDNLAVFNFLSSYTPHPEDSGLIPENSLGFFDVTEWIKKDTGNVDDYGGVKKASDKKEYFDFLLNLRNKKQDSDFSKCNGVFIYNCGGYEQTYIESSDGVFSGFASVKTSTQAYQYDPTVYVYMAGNINGKIIYMNGSFILYDNVMKTIVESGGNIEQIGSMTKDALDQFHNNGLPPESQQQYNEVLDVIRSITVTASKRQINR